MFLGLALTAGRLHAALGVVIIVAAYLRKVRLEEELLHASFGATFEAYRRTSWALVPYLL
jgi:protein-S-isoprenylcysteine O-methyltransferase Ste14